MAHARLTALLVATLAGSAANGCGDGGAGSGRAPALPLATASASSAPAPPSSAFPEEPHRLAHFHSKRFELTIPLPDGKAWKIDDHTGDALVATHAATSSTLTISVLADPDELMTRQKCEARARKDKLVPGAPLRTVADERTFLMESFDTRVWVAIEPPATPAKPLVGHVFAFGGYIHKCFFFHYASSVSSTSGEDVLSTRLALARTRILGEMKIDEFAEVPRQKPNLDK